MNQGAGIIDHDIADIGSTMSEFIAITSAAAEFQILPLPALIACKPASSEISFDLTIALIRLIIWSCISPLKSAIFAIGCMSDTSGSIFAIGSKNIASPI